MISAWHHCPAGWTVEYMYIWWVNTTLMNAESIPGSDASTNEGLFYHVEATCNGLPCPPYDTQKELTCAVCTKWYTWTLTCCVTKWTVTLLYNQHYTVTIVALHLATTCKIIIFNRNGWIYLPTKSTNMRWCHVHVADTQIYKECTWHSKTWLHFTQPFLNSTCSWRSHELRWWSTRTRQLVAT